MAIAIVTDSTSDLSPERAAALGISVVPLFVLFGDTAYRDVVELSRRDFYYKLVHESALPGTSQPSATMFEEAFAPLIARGDDVLCICVSSGLSGTSSAATAGAQGFDSGRVTIYDSKSASGGLLLQVLRAQQLAAAGASMAEILAALDRERDAQQLFACFTDLSHLQRMGRIGKAAAVIGGLMKIVPVLWLNDGKIEAKAQIRTIARAHETMLDLAVASAGNGGDARYILIHTNALVIAQSVCERLQARLGAGYTLPIEIIEAGPAIAAHAGEGAVAIFCTKE